MDNVLSKNRTILILFLEGFVSVSLQMVMMRQLVPFVGSSVIVSSLVVGIFLASLSFGYVYGGRVKTDHIKILSRNLIISAGIISLGASYLFMNFWFSFSNSIINNPILEISLYLLLFLAPIVFLLGQTVPILTNFYKSKNVSEITGDTLAINTIGSVLGSIVTAIVFFYFFGMGKTILIDIVLLGIVLFVLIDKKDYAKKGIVYIPLITFCYFVNVDYEEKSLTLTNSYNNYQVLQYPEGRYLIMNNSYASALMNDDSNWEYINKIKTIMFHDKEMYLENKDILVLGAGGFTLSYGNVPKNNFTYVDIDPMVKEVAEKYFLQNNINGDFIAEDARLFVKKSDKKYDSILVDLYSSRHSIPWHLLTNEFFADIRSAAKKDGYVFFNIVANGRFDSKYTRAIHNTINNNFNYCHSSPLTYDNQEYVNIIYICKNVEEKESEIYVDNFSKSDLDEILN